MTAKECMLFAYRFDGKGGGSVLKTPEEVSHEIKADNLAWVHLDALHPDTEVWLRQELSYLDPFVAGALLAEETRPRVTEIGEGILLILRGVNLNEDARPEDMVSIRMWVDAHRIISVRRRPLKAMRDIEAQLQEGRGPVDAGDFICQLLSRLFTRMEPTLSALDARTDDVEEAVVENPDTSLRESVVSIRKQAILFRRYMMPQRDAIGQLRMSVMVPWLSDKHRRHLQENFDRVQRYVEDLDAVRERAQIVKDELATALADRLNRNMYILSVIAAIFLPLGFLTGLLGINVGGIPGSDNPNAFQIFTGLLSGLVLIQIFVFKRMKWF